MSGEQGPDATLEIPKTDAYQRAVEAIVIEVLDEGVVLDRTVFYARGGGQPGDTGRLGWAEGEALVSDTFHAEGRTIHQIREGDVPKPGTTVRAEIDWDRRYLLMRTHTALHVLSGVVWRDYGA